MQVERKRSKEMGPGRSRPCSIVTTMSAVGLLIVFMGCLFVPVVASEDFITDAHRPKSSHLIGQWNPSMLEVKRYAKSDPIQYSKLPSLTSSAKKRRTKRQLLYFVLNFLGEKGIRDYVKNTKTENIPGLMSSVGPEEILYIVSSLPADEIMRVLTSLPPADVIKLATTLSPMQLMELLSYVPAEGLTNLTNGFSPQQLQILVTLLPPEGIVNLTRTIAPPQAKKLLRSMSPDAIYNLTLSMTPKTLIDLMTSLPPDIVLDMTKTLSPANLERLLKAIPPEVMVTLVTSLPPDVIESLIASLPPGFIESFIANITTEQIGQMVGSLNAEQVAKLLVSFPKGQNLDLGSLLRPDLITAVLGSLPPDLIMNLTQIMAPDEMAKLLASIPTEHIVTVTSTIPEEEMVRLIGRIPPKTFSSILKLVPPETLMSMVKSLPAETIANLTAALSSNHEIISEVMAAVSPELISVFLSMFPQRIMLEIVRLMPGEAISNMASALPPEKFFYLLDTINSTFNLTEILSDIPPSLLIKIANYIPSSVVATISEEVTKVHLRKLFRVLTPEAFRLIATTIPPETIIRFVKAMPERVISDTLQVLTPKTFRSLIEAIPVETIKTFMEVALPDENGNTLYETLIESTTKLANILTSVQPELLTRLFKAIPTSIIVKVIDILPKETIAQGASILSGEEGVPLLSTLPAETIAYMVSVIPPESIVKVIDAVPQRTIGSFANMAMKVPTKIVDNFISLLPSGALKFIVTNLPPKTIEKIVSSLPPETVEKMAQSVSPVTMAPIMESFRPRELRRLIRSVNVTTLSNLLTALPQDLILNLTQAMPAEQLSKLFGAIPPEIITTIISHLDPNAIVSLMKAMPPSVLENILTTLPSDIIVNMTQLLPPEQLQDLLDLLPKNMIGKMISILPPEVLVDLVQAFDPDAMLDMMQKLSSDQLIGILSILPPDVVVNLTRSQTPLQTMAMLGSLPPSGILNLTSAFPPEMFLELLQSIPVEGVFKLMGSLPLKDLFALASQLTPEQIAQMLETLTSDKKLIPNLMASVDFDRILAMAEAVPMDLVIQVVSSVDMSKVMGLANRMMPKVKKFMLDKVEKALMYLALNSTENFRACLTDLDIVVKGVFNFSEWAFKMLDASGKPARGLLEGNIHMIGNFDQCKGISHVITEGPREGSAIAGSYCHVQFVIPMEHLPPVPGDGILPMPEIAMDVCLPDSCKAVDIHRFLKTFRLPLNVSIPRVACQEDQHLTESAGAIITVLVIFLLLLCVAVGTVFDLWFNHHGLTVRDNNNDRNSTFTKGITSTNGHSLPLKSTLGTIPEKVVTKKMPDEEIKLREKLLEAENGSAATAIKLKNMAETNLDNISTHSCKDAYIVKSPDVNEEVEEDRRWLQIITAFSLPRSINSLMRLTDENDNITCLHGIRVLSMLWVSFANTVIFSALYFENLMHAAQDMISISAQIILNSSLAQDTFFCISGVVTALIFLRRVSRSGHMTIVHLVYYYIHRFLRILPAYLLVLLVCTCLLGYVGSGPHWPPPLQDYCVEQWWSNLLFVNNYFYNIEHMCMSWTWFLSNLMQFYWLAPIILIPLALGWRMVGLVLVGLLVVVHIVTTTVFEISVNGDILRRQAEYLWKIYQQPYCRIAPFAMGLGLAYILHRAEFRFRMRKAVVGIGWLVTVATSTALVLVTYDENRFLLIDATGWSLASRTTHEVMQRPLWSAVVCWVIFACSTGYGGLINKFLSWRGFLPLSRLTYCVYLIHPVVIISDLMAYRVFAYFTISYVVFRYIGYIVVAYILALLLAVVSQTPILALEKAFMANRN